MSNLEELRRLHTEAQACDEARYAAWFAFRAELRAQYAAGVSGPVLADALGMTRQRVHQVLTSNRE